MASRCIHGGLLRQARKAQGLSVEELATRLGVSLSYLAMVERGERRPALELLCRILEELRFEDADALDVLVAYLAGGGKVAVPVPAAREQREYLARVFLSTFGR